MIEHAGCLLLLQRNHAPFRNDWNLPSGYVEYDESPSHAAVREVFEESGLQVMIKRLLNIYFFADDPRGNGVLIVYKCQILGGELRATSEAIHPTFFAPQNLPENLAGGGHDQAIHAWQKAIKLEKNR